MDPSIIGLVSVGVLISLVLLGMHIGLALALVSFSSLWLMTGRFNIAAGMLESTAYTGVLDYIYAVVPLFVLMGLLTTASGATRDLFQSALVGLRRVRGGLGIATVAANAVFAAVTGVSVASAAVFSKVAVPEMTRLNYDRKFSLGIVASSALLGMLIPPSVLMIIYCVITEQSIGRMFAAGVVPGLLVTFTLSLAIFIRVSITPRLAGLDAKYKSAVADQSLAQGGGVMATILRPWPIYLLILGVLGGIYGGVFTPTEAGAVGAAGAWVILMVRRGMSLKTTKLLLLETGKGTAGIFLLLITSQMYSRMLALSGLPADISAWAASLNMAPIVVILIFMGIILILGCILDSASILLLTMPIMFPVIMAYGIDPIWFGIVAIVTVEIGLLTPPFGMVVFAMKASLPRDVGLGEIFSGALSFLWVLLATLGILIAFPELTLWLPNMLFNG